MIYFYMIVQGRNKFNQTLLNSLKPNFYMIIQGRNKFNQTSLNSLKPNVGNIQIISVKNICF